MKIPIPDDIRELIDNVPKNMEGFSEGISEVNKRLDTLISLFEEFLAHVKEK